MESIRADLSVSMSEFKRNPAQVKREAGMRPIAVLNHNKPAFYLLDPDLYEAMLEKLDDISLLELVNERLKLVDQAIEVDIEKI